MFHCTSEKSGLRLERPSGTASVRWLALQWAPPWGHWWGATTGLRLVYVLALTWERQSVQLSALPLVLPSGLSLAQPSAPPWG